MNKQPEALRLADELDVGDFDVLTNYDAAAKLRHLHEVNQELLKALKNIANIELQMYGPDWEEIKEAQEIAETAITKAGKQP